MRRFSPSMCTAVAAAEVNGMSAITNCIKAYERNGEDRLECLMEAKKDLEDFMADLNRAIAVASAKPGDAEKAINAVLGIMGAA